MNKHLNLNCESLTNIINLIAACVEWIITSLLQVHFADQTSVLWRIELTVDDRVQSLPSSECLLSWSRGFIAFTGAWMRIQLHTFLITSVSVIDAIFSLINMSFRFQVGFWFDLQTSDSHICCNDS